MLAALIYFATHDILGAIVILVIGLAFAVFGARKPMTIKYSLSEDGIHIGEKFYPYAAFKSFAIIEEGALDSIWLRPLKRFMQPVNIYYAPDDENTILDVLSNFLPLEAREPDLIERTARRLRF